MNWYKRYVYWQLRWMEKIPGFGWYTRLIRRGYDRNFWAMTVLSMLIGLVVHLAVNQWMQDRLANAVERLENQVYEGREQIKEAVQKARAQSGW